MESFIQPKINGYRQLTETDALRINEIKDWGSKIGTVIEGMASEPEFDQRWVAIAKTQIQQGLMALVRAVAKPTGF